MGSQPSGISGSRSSIILGLNKYQTEFEVWQRIMEERSPGFNESQGYIFPDDPDNAPIRWGNAFEGAILELTEQSSDSLIGEREEFYTHSDIDYLTCHIDGKYEDGVIHEGKTTNIFTFNEEWGEPGTDRIPTEYMIQCQHNLMVTGAEECILSVLVFPKRVEDFEKDGISLTEKNGVWSLSSTPIVVWAQALNQMGYFHQYRIPANKNIQEKLLAHYQNWWNNHILKKQPPEAKDYSDILRMIPNPVGTILIHEEDQHLFKRYRKATKTEGRLKKVKDDLKIKILSKYGSGLEEEESVDKLIFKDQAGEKLGSFNGKQFRAAK